MNKKILVTLGIIFIAVISISSVSAIWPFDSGNDVTVNGVNFHLPDGFDTNNPKYSNSNGTYENTAYKNNNTKDIVEITVEDKYVEDSVIENTLINKGFERTTIKGKEGFYKMNIYTKDVEFIYIDNDKVVSIIVPYIYDQYGDNVKQYDELLDEIIK